MRTYTTAIYFVLMITVAARGATTLHVSAKGDDRNAGTQAQPFATLSRARDEIRKQSNHGAVTVVVHAGTYRQTETFQLDARDSDTQWQAAPGEEVRIDGGISVDAKALSPVKDEAILKRLPESARAHVLVADLVSLGVPSVANWPTQFRGSPKTPELFFNDQRMQIARWPNEGWATINKVIDAGADPRDGDTSGRLPVFTIADPRPRAWNADEGVWLFGEFTYNWYDEVTRVKSIDRESGAITLALPALYSVKSGRFYALNLLEELDSAGEFYIDATNRKLYFWPPAPIEGARIALSTLSTPLLSISKAKHVTISGMTFENDLTDCITVSDCTAVRIDRCIVRNGRELAIDLNGGSDDVINGCEIYDTGAGGIHLEGGDRKTLTPAHHLASNNKIHDFSQLQRTAAYAITVAGVGNKAAHNLIYNGPHQAISIAGNDNFIEYNILHDIVTDASDAGAVYKGRDPSCRGNVIRYNFFRDIGRPGNMTCAVYFDDGDGGDSVIGNIFLRCWGDQGMGAIFSHGGFDILAQNNIIIDSKRAFGSTPWAFERWKDALSGGQDCNYPTKLLKNVDITSDVYTKHYPELIGFMNPQPTTPRNNHAINNVLVRCGEVSNGNWKCDPKTTWSTKDDPGFVDAAHDDFRLRSDAELLKHLPEFKPIPFEEIGPKKQ